MKYQKPQTARMYGYGLIYVVISILLVAYATPYIYKAYLGNWAVLAVALLICVTPFGNKKLVAEKKEKPRHAFLPWLCRIFILELALFFIFLGVVEVCTHWLPALTTLQPNALAQANQLFFRKLGLFPWAIFALYAGRLGYISYCENTDAQMSEVLKPLFRYKDDDTLSISFNLNARLATTIALSTTFAFITLLIVALIEPRDFPFLTGFHAKTTVIILALILFGFTPPFKRLLKHLLSPKIPLFLSILSVLVLFTVIMLLLNGLFFHSGTAPIKIPGVIQWMEKKSWSTLWIIFALSWWICWTPLMASHIARLSRGYRVRSTIIATLILPAVFCSSLWLFPNAMANALGQHHYLISLLALAAFVYLLWRFTEKTVLPMLVRSYLPKRDQYKRRDHRFYLRKVFQTMLIVIYIYVPAGIPITCLFVFALVLPFTVEVIFSVVSSVIKCFR